jgi:hypothetical protein
MYLTIHKYSIATNVIYSNNNYMDEGKTNLMQLLYIFIVAVGDALHVSGVFVHRQER